MSVFTEVCLLGTDIFNASDNHPRVKRVGLDVPGTFFNVTPGRDDYLLDRTILSQTETTVRNIVGAGRQSLCRPGVGGDDVGQQDDSIVSDPDAVLLTRWRRHGSVF